MSELSRQEIVSPLKTVLLFSQCYSREVITKYDLGHGFDVAIEASGAEVCATMAICILKADGACESLILNLVATCLADRISGTQAGLGKPMTSLPLFLITANELDVKRRLV